jgi:recombination protein RecT
MTDQPTNGNNGEQAIATRNTLRWYLESADSPYQARINQLLGQRAPQFAASLMSLAHSSKQFAQVRPSSVIAAGVIAATLDLPIDKNLGFAWIIPYGELAQFQIGYKGYVQLALRSGRYAGMNAVKVNAEALGGFDQIGDPLIKWDQLDETKEAIGYAFAWRLTTGFTKVVYWPKKAVEAHAQKYSQAYRAKKKDSPWFGEFDKMALKTLITISLKRWGIMSVEDRFQLAFERDQSAAIDIDATPIYPDNETESAGDEQTTEAAPADLSNLTEKLTKETAPVAVEPEAPAPAVEVAPDPRGPAPWETAQTTPLTLVADAAKAAPMQIDDIRERLSKAVYVADVRALKTLWVGPSAVRSEAEKQAITDLCDARIKEIKSAGTAQKGQS